MIDILNIHKSLSDIANTWDQQPVIEIVNEIISPKKAKSLNINSYINRSITHTR
jgi:hypothetical protein